MAAQARGPVGAVQGAPPGLSPLLWSRLLQILDAQAAADPVQVLDCGGGSGSLAVPLAARGAQVTVVDISIDALATLLRRATEAGVADRVTAVQADAEAVAEVLPSASFDLVLAHGVLQSVANPAYAVRQLAGVLRPGGVASLLVSNPVAAVIGRLLAGDVSAALDGFRRSTATAYAPDAAIGQCLDAGLMIESVEGIGVFTELVPGIELERPGVLGVLADLEEAAATVSPYREIASRLHVLARRPATG
ncbi:MAG: methyltransferase domain-containing protein [Jatrophihabitans sp.]